MIYMHVMGNVIFFIFWLKYKCLLVSTFKFSMAAGLLFVAAAALHQIANVATVQTHTVGVDFLSFLNNLMCLSFVASMLEMLFLLCFPFFFFLYKYFLILIDGIYDVSVLCSGKTS